MFNRTRVNFFNLVGLVFGFWLCSFCAAFSQTTVLLLRNGDRLTGRIIAETTNQVVLATSWAPQLTVPLSEIAKRDIASPAQGLITNGTTQTNVATAIAGTGTNLITTNILADLDLAKAAEVKAKASQRWHGEVQVGTDLGFSENERQLYYGRFKFIYAREIAPHRFFKNTFDLNGTYGRTDGITSANLVNGSSKTDFDLTKRVFVYNLAGSGYDEIRKIDFQYEVGPGFGYHVLMLTNFVLNAEIGLNYQAQYFKRQKTLERYFYRLAEDSKWFINKKLSFDEKFEFFPQADLQEYRLRFESNLRYTFRENFIFTLTLLETYDTQPANGIAPNDLQVRSTLGLKF